MRFRSILARGWLALLAAALLAAGTGIGYAAQALPALQRLSDRGARVSAVAVDLQTGNTLWRIHPNRRLIPASLTKLFTAAAVLDAWGPQKTFTTRLLSRQRPDGGVLDGDLILQGGGDPALTNERLLMLAGKLRTAGVTRVTGDLVIDESLFGPVPCITRDRCEARRRSRNAYDAPVSAAGINYGAWCVAVDPARSAGSPASVAPCGFGAAGLQIRGRVQTVAADQPYRVRAVRRSGQSGDVVKVSGTIAADAHTEHVYRAASDPSGQTGTVLRNLLTLSGIRLEGSVVGRIQGNAGESHPGLHVLASVESIPLSEQVRRMLTYSNNYMADVLALDLLAEDPDAARPLGLAQAGAQVLERSRQLAGSFASGDGTPALYSGSGLTVESRLSAADIASLLAGAYRRSDLFPAFLGALSVPQYSPLNILQGDEPAWSKRVAAKSGSMSEPVSVFGVAGYFRKQDDGWGAFAVLLNGAGKLKHVSYADSMAAIRSDVSALLDRY